VKNLRYLLSRTLPCFHFVENEKLGDVKKKNAKCGVVAFYDPFFSASIKR